MNGEHGVMDTDITVYPLERAHLSLRSVAPETGLDKKV